MKVTVDTDAIKAAAVKQAKQAHSWMKKALRATKVGGRAFKRSIKAQS